MSLDREQVSGAGLPARDKAAASAEFNADSFGSVGTPKALAGAVGELPDWPQAPYRLKITSTEGIPHRWTVGFRFNRERLRIGEKLRKHRQLDATVIMFPPGVDAPIPGTKTHYDQKIGGIGIQAEELIVYSLDDKPVIIAEVMSCQGRDGRALKATATFSPFTP